MTGWTRKENPQQNKGVSPLPMNGRKIFIVLVFLNAESTDLEKKLKNRQNTANGLFRGAERVLKAIAQ